MQLNWHPPIINKAIATHAWLEDYAADVHNGQRYKSGITLPGRPWVDLTLNEFDLAALIANKCRQGESLNAAFVAANEALATTFDENMQLEIWDWANVTVRQSGEVAGSPRNIVDLGNLMNSRVLAFS